MPPPPDDRRLILALGLLAVLVLAQAGALARQFLGGYRPFGPAPSRIPLSWDMFATHIERCDLSWQPPLPASGPAGERLSRAGAPFEWFVVRGTREGYRALAAEGCRRTRVVTAYQLSCWLPDGTRVEQAGRCP